MVAPLFTCLWGNCVRTVHDTCGCMHPFAHQSTTDRRQCISLTFWTLNSNARSSRTNDTCTHLREAQRRKYLSLAVTPKPSPGASALEQLRVGEFDELPLGEETHRPVKVRRSREVQKGERVLRDGVAARDRQTDRQIHRQTEAECMRIHARKRTRTRTRAHARKRFVTASVQWRDNAAAIESHSLAILRRPSLRFTAACIASHCNQPTPSTVVSD